MNCAICINQIGVTGSFTYEFSDILGRQYSCEICTSCYLNKFQKFNSMPTNQSKSEVLKLNKSILKKMKSQNVLFSSKK